MASSVVLFGSSIYTLPVLEILSTHPYVDVHAIITSPDRPAGRGQELTPNPVKVLGEKHHLPVFTSIPEFMATNPMGGTEVPVGLIAAYGYIVPQDVIDAFNNRLYNIHPSLLPKYRGPSPLQQTILDGVTETGVSVIQIDNQVDHGPILAQEKYAINPNTPALDLGQALFGLGTHLFIEFLMRPHDFPPKAQDDSHATFTHKITKDDGFVEWDTFRKEIEAPDSMTQRKFRAFTPWPGVWTLLPSGKRLKLTSINPLMVQVESTPRPIRYKDLQV